MKYEGSKIDKYLDKKMKLKEGSLEDEQIDRYMERQLSKQKALKKRK